MFLNKSSFPLLSCFISISAAFKSFLSSKFTGRLNDSLSEDLLFPELLSFEKMKTGALQVFSEQVLFILQLLQQSWPGCEG